MSDKIRTSGPSGRKCMKSESSPGMCHETGCVHFGEQRCLGVASISQSQRPRRCMATMERQCGVYNFFFSLQKALQRRSTSFQNCLGLSLVACLLAPLCKVRHLIPATRWLPYHPSPHLLSFIASFQDLLE